MTGNKTKAAIFKTKYFGLIIGALLVALFYFLGEYIPFSKQLELGVLDGHFASKISSFSTSVSEDASQTIKSHKISEDILIVGVDSRSLTRFGRWPWPRFRFADLLSNFARIKRENERESAIFLDFFYIEQSDSAIDDFRLVESIAENNRVFVETVLQADPPEESLREEFYSRHNALFENVGSIININGPWQDLPVWRGLEPPLTPIAENARGYGHANLIADEDTIFRRQPMIARTTQMIEEIDLDEWVNNWSSYVLDVEKFERFGWTDIDGRHFTVDYPLTQEIVNQVATNIRSMAPYYDFETDEEGNITKAFYNIRRYQDYFTPSITLALAAHHLHISLDEIEVNLGENIILSDPKIYDVETGNIIPYSIIDEPAVNEDVYDEEGIFIETKVVKEAVMRELPEIVIPIGDYADMLINFMGHRTIIGTNFETYQARGISGYMAPATPKEPDSWRTTKAVGNKIIMVGAFAQGMADDEKSTPINLMYGVEIHANALNTILMDNFIHPLAQLPKFFLIFGLVMVIATLSSRMPTFLALIFTVVFIAGLFISSRLIFIEQAIHVPFVVPSLSTFISFLAIVLYRGMTEEREKKKVQTMFGKYVSPTVVEQILEDPPELGGVDKELTVLFSDIRGFTTLSEAMTPQELVNHLNIYLTSMTDLIMEYTGTLDKYVGDEIMCFWGAPKAQAEHALLACQCALKQMEALNKLNQSWPPDRKINIGIGINSGIMTVGNMGSPGRMNYTLMGDNVNLGARLEGANKQYFTNVLISEYTYGLVKDKVIARELDNIRVKGKNKPVVVYELIDIA